MNPKLLKNRRSSHSRVSLAMKYSAADIDPEVVQTEVHYMGLAHGVLKVWLRVPSFAHTFRTNHAQPTGGMSVNDRPLPARFHHSASAQSISRSSTGATFGDQDPFRCAH